MFYEDEFIVPSKTKKATKKAPKKKEKKKQPKVTDYLEKKKPDVKPDPKKSSVKKKLKTLTGAFSFLDSDDDDSSDGMGGIVTIFKFDLCAQTKSQV